MAISKIQFKASAQATPVVWMDVTQDTVAAAHLETDYTAHDASGTQITGTLVPGGGPSYTWETVWSGQVGTTSEWGNGYYYAMISPFTENIAYESVWRITWDSVPYECTATWEGNPYANPYALGNNTYDDGQGGNNEPFFMQRYSGNELYVVSTNGTYTLTIEKQVESSGGGLEYEEGTWTPTGDTTSPTISFTNAHTNLPYSVLIVDVADSYDSTQNTMYVWAFTYWFEAFGIRIYYSSSDGYTGMVNYMRRATSTTSVTNNTSNQASTNPSTLIKNNEFTPNSYNASTYWRAGHTYKWIAIWAPTT